MTQPAVSDMAADPFEVLGIAVDSSEQVVRARYLELVKKYPPEREPEKFREIQAAYQAARDPLLLARKLVDACNPDDAPAWQSVINRHAASPPPMTAEFLLSLGNQVSGFVAPAVTNTSQSGTQPAVVNQVVTDSLPTDQPATELTSEANSGL